MPVAHTFDLTHSPYGSLVHQQRTAAKPTRLFFCRFFLAQNLQHTATRLDTNRRAARAVAKHKTTHQQTHLYIPGGAGVQAYPRLGAGVCGCLLCAGVVRCSVSVLIVRSWCECAGFAGYRSASTLLGKCARVAGSFAKHCQRLPAVDQSLRVVPAICRLVCWWLVFVVVQRRAH